MKLFCQTFLRIHLEKIDRLSRKPALEQAGLGTRKWKLSNSIRRTMIHNMPKLRVCLTADESLLDSVWFEVAQVAQKF